MWVDKNCPKHSLKGKQMEEKKALTVREVRSLLFEIENQNLPVIVEGCDCEERAGGVEVLEGAWGENNGKYVLIKRLSK